MVAELVTTQCQSVRKFIIQYVRDLEDGIFAFYAAPTEGRLVFIPSAHYLVVSIHSEIGYVLGNSCGAGWRSH